MKRRPQTSLIYHYSAGWPADVRSSIVTGAIFVVLCLSWTAEPCTAKPVNVVWAPSSLSDGLATPSYFAATNEEAVGRGREALAREGFPWYDAEHDAVRPVRVRPPQPAPAGNTSGSSSSASLPQGISWLVVAVVFGIALFLLARAYLNREMLPAGGVREPAKTAAANDATRIEALPFRIRPADHDLLEEARRQYESGHYEAAIIYLFSYQLVEMDKHQVLRLTKGKTNRQYLRDLRRQPRLSRLIEQSMIAFEEVFFGDRRLGREAFESRWRALDEFHSLVRRQVAT